MSISVGGRRARRVTRALAVLALALVTTSCRKDAGPEQLDAARARYEQLVMAGTSPRDPAFDEVLRRLDEVPKDSRARPEAERLREAIVRGRGPHPARPLATASELRSDDPEVAAKQAECSKLAQQLGGLDERAREVKRIELEHCRRALEELLAIDRHHHPEAPPPAK